MSNDAREELPPLPDELVGEVVTCSTRPGCGVPRLTLPSGDWHVTTSLRKDGSGIFTAQRASLAAAQPKPVSESEREEALRMAKQSGLFPFPGDIRDCDADAVVRLIAAARSSAAPAAEPGFVRFAQYCTEHKHKEQPHTFVTTAMTAVPYCPECAASPAVAAPQEPYPVHMTGSGEQI